MDELQALTDIESAAKLIGPALRYLESVKQGDDLDALKKAHEHLNQAAQLGEQALGLDLGTFNALSGGGDK